ncbi:MAG: selenocysteine-specific translation elongation factor [Desulfocurvibacter africanus]
MPIIMGTAGHIDHGKTSLVRALTGIDCDRLEEEKRRGITIELGFAYLDLPGIDRLGIVDVPGHERFVKNMVAGAAGIDFVMLVIAADEGVMPQTREHLEICSLLGTDTGLVALTKVDMVDEELLELVQEDISEFLQGTFLEGAPVMPVSSHTGQGMDALKAKLAEIATSFKPRRRTDLFRLPIDRIFSMKGYGTVITGTLVAGAVGVGQDVLVYPQQKSSKVRTIQVHGRAAEKALAGQRTAVNLAGVEVEELERGQVLAVPGSLFPSLTWDIELTLLKSASKPLKHRKEVHFHHGSREVLARVYLLDRDQLMPGETCACQVRFEEPLVGVYGDRVVLRSYSPLRTIGGGKLINPLGRKVKRRSEQVQVLYSLAGGEPEALALGQLRLAGPEGLSFAQLVTMTNLESKALEKMLGQLGGQQKAFLFDKDARVYVSGALLDELCASAAAFTTEYHRKNPLKPGLSRSELASDWGKGLPAKLFHFVVERLLKRGELIADQEVLRLPGHKVSLASDEAKMRGSILAAYEQGGITPPNLKDVLDPLGVDFKQAAPVFKLLQDQGELLKIKEDMYFSRSAMEKLKGMIVGFFEKQEEMGPPDFKDLTSLSRKYAIPVLEYLDKEKITVRVGDKRRLRKR